MGNYKMGDFIGDDLSGVHTCHAECPCHADRSPAPTEQGEKEARIKVADRLEALARKQADEFGNYITSAGRSGDYKEGRADAYFRAAEMVRESEPDPGDLHALVMAATKTLEMLDQAGYEDHHHGKGELRSALEPFRADTGGSTAPGSSASVLSPPGNPLNSSGRWLPRPMGIEGNTALCRNIGPGVGTYRLTVTEQGTLGQKPDLDGSWMKREEGEEKMDYWKLRAMELAERLASLGELPGLHPDADWSPRLIAVERQELGALLEWIDDEAYELAPEVIKIVEHLRAELDDQG